MGPIFNEIKLRLSHTFVCGILFTQEGYTALYYAISNGMDASIDLLLRAGARVNAAGKGGKTAAHFAAEMGRCNALRRIALEGADFNIRNWVSLPPCQTFPSLNSRPM